RRPDQNPRSFSSVFSTLGIVRLLRMEIAFAAQKAWAPGRNKPGSPCTRKTPRLGCGDVRSPSILIVCIFSVALAGCGVAFSDPPQGNEFFKSLSISGDKRVGQQLTAAVAVK